MLADDAQDPWDDEASADGHEEPAALSEADRHDEPAAPSGADLRIRGSGMTVASPPPPLPTDSARPMKRLRRKTADANFALAGLQNMATLSTTLDSLREEAKRSLRESGGQPKQEEQHFFHIQAMADGPDSRSKLEAAVQNVAELLRDNATVPADVEKPKCRAEWLA